MSTEARTLPPFSKVWRDVLDVVSKSSSISTLVHGIRNDIVGVNYSYIKVKSQRTGNTRIVPRSQFELVWNSLVSDGFYVSGTHKPYVHSQIICAILSLLDYIEVRYGPLTLYLRSRKS